MARQWVADVNDMGRPQPAATRHRRLGQRHGWRIRRWLNLMLVAAGVALVVRLFVAQPFLIASSSMQPTLAAGDLVLVDKLAYGWSPASLSDGAARLAREQWPDAGAGRLFGRVPARGEVIVFQGTQPMDGGRLDYVKRVVGLPGDRVAVSRGMVLLNGAPLLCLAQGNGTCVERLDGRSWRVVEGGVDDMAPMVVPPGHLFVLGDYRAASADSRQPPRDGGLGFVAQSDVVGRAAGMLARGGPGAPEWRWLP